MVAKHFEHPRIREAFSFHSMFIGGDPFRVPAIYAALVYLQFLDEGWYANGGVYSIVEAMAAPLDVRCGEPVDRRGKKYIPPPSETNPRRTKLMLNTASSEATMKSHASAISHPRPAAAPFTAATVTFPMP